MQKECEYVPIVRQYITASGTWVELIKLHSSILIFASDECKDEKRKRALDIIRSIMSDRFLQNEITGDVIITDVSHGPIELHWLMKSITPVN